MSLRATLIKASGGVGAIVVIVGATWGVIAWADSRYVPKSEAVLIKESIIQNRRDNLDDKVFEIELKPETKRNSQDKALLERYKSQIMEIDSKRQQGKP